jgi:hypothetical protein
MKKSAKVGWETPNSPFNIKYSSRIFEDRFVGKEPGLRTHKPSSEEKEG